MRMGSAAQAEVRRSYRHVRLDFNAGQTTDVAARSPFYAMKAELENTGSAPARYHVAYPA